MVKRVGIGDVEGVGEGDVDDEAQIFVKLAALYCGGVSGKLGFGGVRLKRRVRGGVILDTELKYVMNIKHEEFRQSTDFAACILSHIIVAKYDLCT